MSAVVAHPVPRAGPRHRRQPPGALVLGADYRGLGVVRSLGRRGIPVCVMVRPGETLASTSRYVERAIHLPDGETQRLKCLLDLADHDDLAGWALIPTADETAALVGRHHATLATRFTHTSPDWETVRWAYDKRLTYELATRIGVASPRTVFPAGAAELQTLDLAFPVVLKPTVKEDFNRLTAAKAWRVDDRRQLLELYAEACELVDPSTLMVQELVPGGGAEQLSFVALCAGGEPLAWHTARRTRQYPADFGRASTFVETAYLPDIEAPARRLLREINFSGVVEVEFKRHPATGTPQLLDINPRFWGWHTLSVRAGIDFPYLLWLLASGEEVPPSSADLGVRWLRLATDTPTALKELAGGRLGLREYARSLSWPREAAIFAWDDPVPGLLEVPMLARLLYDRVRHGDAL